MSQFDKFKTILEQRLLDEQELAELRSLSESYALANPLPKEALGDLGDHRRTNDLLAFWCSVTGGVAVDDKAGMARVKNVHSAVAASIVRLFNPMFDIKS